MTNREVDTKSIWDKRFIKLAMEVASWSKDPSTKVGAVIVDSKKRLRSIGYNGFPLGVEDSGERLENKDTKLALVVHAEANAILFAREDLSGCSLYVTLPPCSRCAGLIIQSGISKVFYPKLDEISDRWKESFSISKQMFLESGVEFKEIDCT